MRKPFCWRFELLLKISSTDQIKLKVDHLKLKKNQNWEHDLKYKLQSKVENIFNFILNIVVFELQIQYGILLG